MLLAELVRALESGEEVVLATIVGTSGSTPVPAGSAMFLASEIPVGTVGGGCVEADVIRAARELRSSGRSSALLRFTLEEDDIETGMLCGGKVEILLERMGPARRGLYSLLNDRVEAGEDTLLLTRIDGEGRVADRELMSLPDQAVSPEIARAAAEAMRTGILVSIPSGNGSLVVEPVAGLQDLFVFGGGHVSKYVSRSASMAGFRVTVVDDRPEYANSRRFPEAWRTIPVPFDRAWEQLTVHPSGSIVIVTRGHKFDERVLEVAVRTPARYIGMIGSAKKVAATFRNLRQRGISEEQLMNVRAPIGLAIGARTAEEIGISITAELIAVRRGIPGVVSPMCDIRR